jgi:hypothetical protein
MKGEQRASARPRAHVTIKSSVPLLPPRRRCPTMAESLRQLECSACGAPIRMQDIHVDLGIAKCSRCGGVMDIGLKDVVSRAARDRRPEVPLPEKFNVERVGSTMSVQWRWFGLKYVMTAFFCVAWDGFLLFWYGMAIKTGNAMMILFPIAHVAVGVSLTYWTLAGFLNRTRIEATQVRLRIKHFPLPWFGNRELETNAIEQLFTKEKISRNNNGQTVSYEVHAILRPNGRRQKLLAGLDDVGQALWIEQSLESHLGIADEPVAGEVPRGALGR